MHECQTKENKHARNLHAVQLILK